MTILSEIFTVNNNVILVEVYKYLTRYGIQTYKISYYYKDVNANDILHIHGKTIEKLNHEKISVKEFLQESINGTIMETFNDRLNK